MKASKRSEERSGSLELCTQRMNNNKKKRPKRILYDRITENRKIRKVIEANLDDDYYQPLLRGVTNVGMQTQFPLGHSGRPNK